MSYLSQLSQLQRHGSHSPNRRYVNGNHSTNGTSTPLPSPKPRILITEKLSKEGIELLNKTCQVITVEKKSFEEICDLLDCSKGEGFDALIIRSETQAKGNLLKSGLPRLKIVARAGVGVDNVDVKEATQCGIIVINSPLGNVRAAAEHTISLLMSLARNIPGAVASLKGGKWQKSQFTGIEVQNKVLGIIGLGKIGLNVARMANGLGMKVYGLDPYASPVIAEQNNVKLFPTLETLLPLCDFITLHTPLTASTKGLISAPELKLMKRGARILNVARGGMIDEKDLLEALEQGHIAGAGIDVYVIEPPPNDSISSTLIQHPNVIATPHLGASTKEAQENVALDVCQQILEILKGSLPKSAVNVPMILEEEFKTLQPFVKLLEKMGNLYYQHYQKVLKGNHSMTLEVVYEGNLAELKNTKPLYAALVKGLLSNVTEASINIVNAELIAKDRGLLINETRIRSPTTHTYSSLVTLKARPLKPNHSLTKLALTNVEPIISGYSSEDEIFISRLDCFLTNFIPEGNLIILHNFNRPGKIGKVGMELGKVDVNINFMMVAPRQGSELEEREEDEALMILGVDREIEATTVEALKGIEGILDVSLVSL